MTRLSVLSLAVIVLFLWATAQGIPQRSKRATVEAVMPLWKTFGIRQSVDPECAASLPEDEPLRVIECMRCALDEENFFLPGQRYRGEWNSQCLSCGPCMATGARCTMHAMTEGGCKTSSNVRQKSHFNRGN